MGRFMGSIEIEGETISDADCGNQANSRGIRIFSKTKKPK
jgi:hypothetical protein